MKNLQDFAYSQYHHYTIDNFLLCDHSLHFNDKILNNLKFKYLESSEIFSAKVQLMTFRSFINCDVCHRALSVNSV